MKVEVQWTTDPAAGWIPTDSRLWPALPAKPAPPSNRKSVFDPEGKVIGFTGPPVTLDAAQGWIARVCIHGVVFSGDVFVLEHDAASGDVRIWTEMVLDARSPFPGARVIELWEFEEAFRKTSLRMADGSLMTSDGPVHRRTVYVDEPGLAPQPGEWASGGLTRTFPLAAAAIPGGARRRFGIGVLDTLWRDHERAESSGYESWRPAR